MGGQDSSVGTAAHYELHGLESNPGGDNIYSKPSRPAPGSTQLSVQLVPGLFLGIKQLGCDDHRPTSSTNIQYSILIFLPPLTPCLACYKIA
jgi:hypothetical protein